MNIEVVDIRGDSSGAGVVRAKGICTDLFCKGSKVNDDKCEPYSLVNIRISRPRYDLYLIVG